MSDFRTYHEKKAMKNKRILTLKRVAEMHSTIHDEMVTPKSKLKTKIKWLSNTFLHFIFEDFSNEMHIKAVIKHCRIEIIMFSTSHVSAPRIIFGSESNGQDNRIQINKEKENNN